jgi:hypothetical protein
MPTVAVVGGVKIVFYANEHPPPHFHAKYAEHQAVIDICTMTLTQGVLPAAKRRMVLEWAASRRNELLVAFHAASAHEKVEPIE